MIPVKIVRSHEISLSDEKSIHRSSIGVAVAGVGKQCSAKRKVNVDRYKAAKAA